MEVDDFIRTGLGLLTGETLTWSTYIQYGDHWDHDHCEFCFAKFVSPEHAMATDPETLQAGWATADQYRWVCEACELALQPHATWTREPRP